MYVRPRRRKSRQDNDGGKIMATCENPILPILTAAAAAARKRRRAPCRYVAMMMVVLLRLVVDMVVVSRAREGAAAGGNLCRFVHKNLNLWRRLMQQMDMSVLRWRARQNLVVGKI